MEQLFLQGLLVKFVRRPGARTNVETPFTLSIPNSELRIHGLLREADNDAIAVIVHGLGGSLHEQQNYNGARAIEAAGFSVLRVSLYGGELDSRNLMDCDIDTHVADVELVLQHLRDAGRRIAYIGHSLGGVIAQRLRRDLFDVAVLWDPADEQMPRFSEWEDAEWSDVQDMWIMHWGPDVLVSRELEQSWWNSSAGSHDLECPTKLIGASDSWLPQPTLRFADAQSGSSELVIIEGADHSFNLNDSADQLHQETVAWLRQHL